MRLRTREIKEKGKKARKKETERKDDSEKPGAA